MEESMKQPDFCELVEDGLSLPRVHASDYSPLILAYIGDAVYELMIRTKVVSQGNMQVHKLHQKSTALVNAGTQAAMLRALKEELSEEELAVYKRGRNAKSATMAKHASMTDYRTATGFEALMGYLYLEGRHERMIALVRSGLEKTGV